MKLVSAKRTRSPAVGRSAEPGHGHRATSAPDQPTSLAQSVLRRAKAPDWLCPGATPMRCRRISTRSERWSRQTPMPSSSSIKQAGICPTSSISRTISPCCPYRRERQSSTPWKMSGSSCATTGWQIASSNPTTISSTTAAMLGTHSPISLGGSCPSE